MPPKNVKPNITKSVKEVKKSDKPVKEVKKSDNKAASKKSQSKIKKKRRNKKAAPWAFTYAILPKRKRLAKKVITKLNNETDRYMLARGLDTIKRLYREGPSDALDKEEQKWRMVKKASAEYRKMLDDKAKRILFRAKRRRQRAQERIREELRHKRYRVHPDDPFHKYKPGFKRKRHRISKSRFMRCVDIPLFLHVLFENKDLVDSPLWEEKLSFKNMSAEKCEQLKDHLYQFDVIVECLKQGIFDIPGCDAFDIYKVRRKQEPGRNQSTISQDSKSTKKKGKKASKIGDERLKVLHRLKSFPPYERPEDLLGGAIEDGTQKNWLNRVTKWIGDMNIIPVVSKPEDSSKQNSIAPSQNFNKEEDDESVLEIPPDSKDEPNAKDMKGKDLPVAERKPSLIRWSQWSQPRKTSLKSVSPGTKKSITLPNDGDGDMGDDDKDLRPFADFITLSVPTDTGDQRKFIRTLVERKKKKDPNASSKHVGVDVLKQEEDDARQRHERTERYDPFQRIIQDDKESDIWSKTITTTTDGYASWRRPRGQKDANKQDILAHKVDTTLGWRVMLLIIILWDIARFVKGQLDDVYYWIFSSHLYRENIWLFEPSLFAPVDQHFIIHVQKWSHVIISTISLSIIHRENECVSLLFAFTSLLEGTVDAGMSIHDYIYLPEAADRFCIALTALHVAWKTFIICLFIGYHYYCAGYIRKAREFQHRKTMLHNHEIKAKGTKGLQKRKMAWTWMTRHARNTNLRDLKKKYADIKDGSFPDDEIADQIHFSETKELRLYTQKHHLTIGYPYNKLRDMKRYVFSRLEKSDYSDKDEMEREEILRKKMRRLMRRESKALTALKYEIWKKNQDDLENNAKRQFLSQVSEPVQRRSHTRSTPNLTIDDKFSRRQLSSLMM